VVVVASAYRQSERLDAWTLHHRPLAAARRLVAVLRIETCGDQMLVHVSVPLHLVNVVPSNICILAMWAYFSAFTSMRSGHQSVHHYIAHLVAYCRQQSPRYSKPHLGEYRQQRERWWFRLIACRRNSYYFWTRPPTMSFMHQVSTPLYTTHRDKLDERACNVDKQVPEFDVHRTAIQYLNLLRTSCVLPQATSAVDQTTSAASPCRPILSAR
jgi:hypothetical protein